MSEDEKETSEQLEELKERMKDIEIRRRRYMRYYPDYAGETEEFD